MIEHTNNLDNTHKTLLEKRHHVSKYSNQRQYSSRTQSMPVEPSLIDEKIYIEQFSNDIRIKTNFKITLTIREKLVVSLFSFC